jgi:hypothetical protein
MVVSTKSARFDKVRFHNDLDGLGACRVSAKGTSKRDRASILKGWI